MSYFPDLSPYTYWDDQTPSKEPVTGVPVVNVGWLDDEHEFTTGEPPEGLVEALRKAVTDREYRVTRGVHSCDLCRTHWVEADNPQAPDEPILLGMSELRALGANDVLYAAPSLVLHYVTDHDYLPPADFCEAVISDRLGGRR
ncbi:hypothetical protein [Streptomyces sp. SPB162]|uniref:DUF7919 family protein n=1 Tax=Streptomyces sp. SPB162 TaxID=2940560 RepID=UPI0024062C69|nr:hypothetical protein [Streptomyces sp. SPB162]MDF9816428.1 hypothetical protein [Streptomyces sp. SPB162]